MALPLPHPRIGTLAALSTALLLAGAYAPAQAFPPSRFTERVSGAGINVSGADANLPENIVINRAGFFGKAETSGAGAVLLPSGGGGPSAEAVLNAVDGGVVSASVTYYFGVAGPAHPLPIPLLIDARLLVEVASGAIVTTDLARINLFADGIIDVTRSLNGCVGAVCEDRRQDLVFDLGLPLGAEGSIGLQAFVQGAGGRIRAAADPFIRIDPAFALADQYSVAVSSLIVNAAPVPEGSVATLMLAGIAAIGCYLRRSRAR